MTATEMAGTALRAANADRERVVEQLRMAHSDGRIDLLEFDERLAAAYAAKTYGELEPLTLDLPHEPGRSSAAAGHADSGRSRFARAHRIALRIETAAWIFASVVNLGIWAIIELATPEAVYPWWIWVAGPWGLVLLARMLGDACGYGSVPGSQARRKATYT